MPSSTDYLLTPLAGSDERVKSGVVRDRAIDREREQLTRGCDMQSMKGLLDC